MILDKLLPDKVMNAGVEELRHARLVLYAALIALITTYIVAVMLYMVGYPSTAFYVFLSGFLHLAVYALLWVGTRARSAAHTFMFLLFAIIALDFGRSDGYEALAAIALPLAASALIGTTGGLIWMVVGVLWSGVLGPFVFRPDIPLHLGMAAAIMTLVVGTAAVVIEFTRRRAVEEGDRQRRLLRDHQQRIETFAESTFPGIAVVSTDRIEYASPGIQDLVGFTPQEFCTAPLVDYVHPDDLDRLMALVGKGSNGFREETRIRHKNGDWVWLEVYAIPDVEGPSHGHWIFAARDVQNERRSREQLVQAQRLEGLGVMAAGIAHDFNNLLSIVIGRAEFLPRGEDRDQILLAASQAASLTESLKAFGKKGSKLIKTVSVNDVLERLQPMFASLLSDISFSVDIADNLQTRLTDGQLDQILLNLVTNAKEAIVTPGDGSVSITGRIEFVSQSVADSVDVKAGRYVVVRVVDNGVGMSEEVKQRAFEPFYSTKPLHAGSGLGLAGAYGIVRESGGFIDIDTHPGQGTTVSVYFPLATTRLKAEPTVDLAAASFNGLSCLLVEDEKEVRQVMQKHLALLGFDVTAVDNAEHALTLCSEQQPDVVVTDVVMPGMRGTDLAAQLRDAYPFLPVLLVSGYGSDQYMSISERTSSQEQNEFRRFLAKPFRLPELQSKLAELVT